VTLLSRSSWTITMYLLTSRSLPYRIIIPHYAGIHPFTLPSHTYPYRAMPVPGPYPSTVQYRYPHTGTHPFTLPSHTYPYRAMPVPTCTVPSDPTHTPSRSSPIHPTIPVSTPYPTAGPYCLGMSVYSNRCSGSSMAPLDWYLTVHCMYPLERMVHYTVAAYTGRRKQASAECCLCGFAKLNRSRWKQNPLPDYKIAFT